MESNLQKDINKISSTNSLRLEYETYIKSRASAINQKSPINYKNHKLFFTPKQIEVLKLIAKGYSNRRIAKDLSLKETTLKLLTYRLMKYIEDITHKTIDRFYLIIIAQEIISEYKTINPD